MKNRLPFVQPHLDPLQFACRSSRGVEDAVATLVHRLLKHLEKPGHHARILSVDFSSAFNTIQRHTMIEKLQQLEVPALTIHWVFNFLSDRPQFVKVADAVSPIRITNTAVLLKGVF